MRKTGRNHDLYIYFTDCYRPCHLDLIPIKSFPVKYVACVSFYMLMRIIQISALDDNFLCIKAQISIQFYTFYLILRSLNW